MAAFLQKILIGTVFITRIATTTLEAQAPTHQSVSTKVEIVSELEMTDEELVRLEFKDVPIMIEVARCESGLRQYDLEGNVLRGKENYKDVGLFQINEFYHLQRAKDIGIDIHTRGGNIAFAKLLYKEQGLRPWIWSNPCHNGIK